MYVEYNEVRFGSQKPAKPSLYGNIERIFYAFKIHSIPQIKDMWDPSENQRAKSFASTDDFDYYAIRTMVGVGAKEGAINKVHIRFGLKSLTDTFPEPEIVLIYPNYISKVVGEIANRKDIESGLRYGIEARGGGGLASSNIGVGLKGLFNYFKNISASKRVTSTLPNEIIISNASGCGTHAIWEFYRGEGIQDVGQYDLEIILRIPHFHGANDFHGTKDFENTLHHNISHHTILYYIDWNIEINGRKLVDHDHDIDNKRWDIYAKYGNHPMKIMYDLAALDKNIQERIKEKQDEYEKEWGRNRETWKRYWKRRPKPTEDPISQDDQKYSVLRLLRPLVLVDSGGITDRISFLQKESDKHHVWQEHPQPH